MQIAHNFAWRPADPIYYHRFLWPSNRNLAPRVLINVEWKISKMSAKGAVFEDFR